MVWGDRNFVLVGSPSSSAAARVNSLNVDPAWKPLESPYLLSTT
jgi:hypothetical protein